MVCILRKLLHRCQIDIIRYPQPFPPDFNEEDIDIINSVREFTATSPERIFSLCNAVRYVVRNNILGDIVECGVWKGGSMMAVARTLLSLKINNRGLYLFDTFEGMPEPTEKDISYGGEIAFETWQKTKREQGYSSWSHCSLDDVKKAMFSVAYDKERILFVKGKVEETIPGGAPQTISLLRLDTDWYESTKHELVHLFPRLSSGGVIIVDDYGHWKGARRAVDEYINENRIRLLLNRIDYTGRIGVKT